MTLKNDSLFLRPPSTFTLPNDGVAHVVRPDADAQWKVLEFELDTFVCEGEYEHGMQRILDSYLRNRQAGVQPAVWVSGFFGSGKSHMVRVLQHLWTNTELPSGAVARGLVRIPRALEDSLAELTTVARRDGAAPWAAAGSLDRSGASLNTVVLSIVLNAARLPVRSGPAQLALWLIEKGYYERVQESVENAGGNFRKALDTFNMDLTLAGAILAADPSLADDAKALRQVLRNEFGAKADVTSTPDTIALLKRVLEYVGGGTIPATLLVLDEVQQYISGDGGRAMEVQNLVEAVSREFGGRLMLVATGQQEMIADSTLAKIQDRFTVKVILKNQDVDAVVRNVLLGKKPSERPALERAMSQVSGAVSRQLSGSKIRHTAQDESVLLEDYPLLPSRRRFWEEVLRQAGSGRAGQLRSQLRIVHGANQSVADRPVGTVVGADFLYTSENDNLNAAGQLLKDTQSTIHAQGAADPLRGRILGLIHLIGLLPTSGHEDIGVRATEHHIVDLLIEDLANDGPTLRQRVPKLLSEMAEQGLLQQDGDEFRLQTAAGRTWEEAFRRHRAEVSDIAVERDNLLSAAVKAIVPARITQGHARESRPLGFQSGDTQPQTSDLIPVWLRSQFEGVTPREFDDLAAGLGSDSPMILVYLPRHDAESFNAALANRIAAQRTIDQQGHPQDDEGKQALASMESRLRRAEDQVKHHVSEVLSRAVVKLAGGRMPDGATLRERIEEGANAAVVRLFSEFEPANKANWPQVTDRVRKGSGEDALKVVGWTGPAEQNPVVKEVLNRINATPTEATRVQELMRAPYGWSHDAIMASIAVLLDGGHVRATINGTEASRDEVIRLGTRLGPLKLRRESVVLKTVEKIKARGILQRLKVSIDGDDLAGATERAVNSLVARARDVSGPAPLPEVEVPSAITAILASSGNDRVYALLTAATDVDEFHEHLDALRVRREQREPQLATARALADAASGLAAAGPARAQLDAFLGSRDLLAPHDQVAGLLSDLTEQVRGAVRTAHEALEAERSARVAALSASQEWSALTPGAADSLLRRFQLIAEPAPDLSGSEAVLRAVRTRPLAAWDAERDAVSTRAAKALVAAVTPMAPSGGAGASGASGEGGAAAPTPVSVPVAVLRSTDEIDKYLAGLREVLTTALEAADAVVVKGS